MRRVRAPDQSSLSTKFAGGVAAVVSCALVGCSGPSFVAKTRGLFFEANANTEYARYDQLTPEAATNYKNAIEQFDSAIKLTPHDAACLYQRGWCRRRLGFQKEALTDLTEAVALEPRDYQAWLMRAALFEDMQLYDKAEEDYTQAEQLAPKMASIWSGKARCEAVLHEYKKSIEDNTTAISISPVPFYYCARAGNYRAAGDLHAMYADYEHALAINPHNWDTYRSRAYSEFISGNYEGAVADFKTMLRGTKYIHAHASYAVLLGTLAARFSKNPNSTSDEDYFLSGSTENFALPVASAPHAENAKVAQRWPLPALQFIYGDISEKTLFQVAGDDRNKLTESHCYAALEDLLQNNKQSALEHFRWILKHGNKCYVEYDVACVQVDKLTGAASKGRGPAQGEPSAQGKRSAQGEPSAKGEPAA